MDLLSDEQTAALADRGTGPRPGPVAHDRGTVEEHLHQWRWYFRHLAYRMARLEEDREDVLQEMVAAVLRLWPTWDPARGAFSTWVTFVARQAVVRVRHQEARRAPRVRISLDWENFNRNGDRSDELADVVPDRKSESPEVAAGRRISIAATAAAVDALPADERAAVRRRFYGDDGGEDHRDWSGTRQAAERRTLRRAMKRLEGSLAGVRSEV